MSVQNRPFAGLAILMRTKLVALKLENSSPLFERWLKQFQFSSAPGGFTFHFAKYFWQNGQKASRVVLKLSDWLN